MKLTTKKSHLSKDFTTDVPFFHCLYLSCILMCLLLPSAAPTVRDEREENLMY